MLMFLLLAGTGLAAFGRVTHDAAVASSLILQHTYPSTPEAITSNLAWAALILALLFSLSAAWLSAFKERPSGLVGMLITGITCWWSAHSFGDGNLLAGWVAFAALAVAGIWAAHATLMLSHAAPAQPAPAMAGC